MNHSVGISDSYYRATEQELLQDYLRAFYVLPERILKDNQPQQQHQRQYLLNFIDEQTGKIQEFINRFNKEMDSS